MREAILQTVSVAHKHSCNQLGNIFLTEVLFLGKKNTENSFQRLVTLKIRGKKRVQRIILFSNFILKYKQDSLGLCQLNSSMYFCLQIPNMKVINIG